MERAFSDYLMYVRDGLEHEDFGRALDLQEERRRTSSPTGYYVETGFYGRQLRPYFAAFPHERIRVYLFEDLVADPDPVLRDLFAFLGVDPAHARAPARPVNVSGVPRNALFAAAVRGGRRLAPLLPAAGRDRPVLSPEDRRRLVRLYRDDVAELERLLDRPLDRWRVS